MTTRNLQRLIWSILIVALLLLGVFALKGWLRHSNAAQLQDFGLLPNFSLVTQTNQPVTRDSMLGKTWIADMVFTHCTTFCPKLTGKMKELSGRLPSDETVRLVSVSVDPRNDPPDTLRAYIAKHELSTARWNFWTGAVPEVYTLIKDGFHMALDSVGGDQPGFPIIHTPRFILVDSHGHMRGYYNGLQDSSQDQMLADLKSLLSEEDE